MSLSRGKTDNCWIYQGEFIEGSWVGNCWIHRIRACVSGHCQCDWCISYPALQRGGVTAVREVAASTYLVPGTSQVLEHWSTSRNGHAQEGEIGFIRIAIARWLPSNTKHPSPWKQVSTRMHISRSRRQVVFIKHLQYEDHADKTCLEIAEWDQI